MPIYQLKQSISLKENFDRFPMLASLMGNYGAVVVFIWLFTIILTTC